MSKQNDLLKELVALRIRRVLLKNVGRQIIYERSLYDKVGRGVTPQEYTEILNTLVSDGVVKLTCGERNAMIVTSNEQQAP